jgi:glycogen synthase
MLLSISEAVTAAMDHPRIVTIQDPVEPPDTTPVPAYARNGRPVVGYLGRLDPRKGVEDVCLAAGAVDADFIVAGEPLLAPMSYVDELRSLADHAAPGRVRFLGGVPGPWNFLASVDVLVVPSRREPWGRVAAEALMSGVPVVAADAGGLPEIVRDGVDGLLYPPGDVDALVRQLRLLTGDAALRARLGRAAREGAARFDPAVHSAHVAAAIDRVVGAPAGG